MKKSADDHNSSTKCFSGILRRLWCTRGSLQTHPSDQLIESNKKEKDDDQKTTENVRHLAAAVSSSPGLVARLMGLDSFPNTPLISTPRDGTLGSYFRSRSVNSIDFLSHFDPTIRKVDRNNHHRRVRTSVSFRENDDYGLVLRGLEKVAENAEYHDDHQEELMIRMRRPKVNYHQQKVKKSENLMEKKVATKKPASRKVETSFQKKDHFDHGKTRSVNYLKETIRRPNIKPLNSKAALIESKCVKRKKKNLAHDHHKVLHYSQCSLKKVHPENNLSGIILCPLAEIAEGMSSYHDNMEVKAIMKGKSKSQKMKNNERGYYKRMVEEICKVAEEDVKENFVLSSDEDFEEICQQFGQEIVELLVKQLVDELNFMGQMSY